MPRRNCTSGFVFAVALALMVFMSAQLAAQSSAEDEPSPAAVDGGDGGPEPTHVESVVYLGSDKHSSFGFVRTALKKAGLEYDMVARSALHEELGEVELKTQEGRARLLEHYGRTLLLVGQDGRVKGCKRGRCKRFSVTIYDTNGAKLGLVEYEAYYTTLLGGRIKSELWSDTNKAVKRQRKRRAAE